ncbi:MAG: GyrI-like domain-containing protein [Spirochaetaceae bacterium]|nr:GyrI-like domain-containing protein [Spirochaetaceae bacterium]
MAKIDLKKQFKELYNIGARAKEPHLIDVPPLQYVMVDGTGDPNTSEEYQRAMGALYAVAYTVKFVAKDSGSDFGVMPLEGLWWTDPPEALTMDDKSIWNWTAMILQPDFVSVTMVDDALASAVQKGKIDPETATKVRLETLREGTSAQVLHIGPYADEAPTIASLHGFVEASGYRLRAKHHEIYMSDPRRVAPEKMKTIIRHPVQQK